MLFVTEHIQAKMPLIIMFFSKDVVVVMKGGLMK